MLSADALECNENERDSKMAVEALNVMVNMSDIFPDATVVNEHGVNVVERYMIYKGCLLWRVADVAQGTRKHDAGAWDTAPSDAFTAMFGNLNIGG